MSLRLEWGQEPETPQIMELALVNRYDAANQLLTLGEWDAAIYLFGYVAEMVLKTACFSVRGNNPADLVYLMLGSAKTRASQIIPGVAYESGHSLLFWSDLLRAERTEQGRPLRQATETNVVLFVRILYQNWMVEMRYHPNRASEADARNVAGAAEWLFDNRLELGT